MKKILVINGPNLNLLGKREPEIYGRNSLKDIEKMLNKSTKKDVIKIDFFQSNHEGAIIDEIQKASSLYDGIIINPGAFTHTSIGIRDAVFAVGIPAIEVHISNIYKREEFRQKSFLAGVVLGQITGLGIIGYELALKALLCHLKK